MSHRIPDAEYAAIKESWRRAPRSEPPFTNAMAIEACHANIKQAARRERELRDLYASLPAGDPRIVGNDDQPPLRLQITASLSDQANWREYLSHYQQRAREEGYDAVVAVPGLGRLRTALGPRQPQPTQPQRPQARDPRLPREPGEDEDDDSLPF